MSINQARREFFDSENVMDEQLKQQIMRYRSTAQEMGDAAVAAMTRGDAGLARTAARQAAQWARIVMQLESGKRLIEPEDQQPSPLQVD